MPDAALVTHHHVCPAMKGNTPHVGGPIKAGGSVKINGQALARVGDPADCTGVGEIDKIIGGSGSVMVDGKPAARKGDPMAHGGVIVQGDSSVVIG